MTGMTEPSTPLMRQYQTAKKRHPDALLLFRLGDFYELFFDDAVAASRLLQITLTSRNKEKGQAIPMCGVPYHAAEGYIARLIRAGKRVAICEQMEEAGPGKKLVQREVVRVLSPGTAMDAQSLAARDNNFLAAIARHPVGPLIGFAYVDFSTGQFRATEFAGETAELRLQDELQVLRPREILLPRATNLFSAPTLLPGIAIGATSGPDGPFAASPPTGNAFPALDGIAATRTMLDEWVFDREYAARMLREQFRVINFAGFGLEDHLQAIAAAGAIIHYLRENTHLASHDSAAGDSASRDSATAAAIPGLRPSGAGLEHLDHISFYQQHDSLVLDGITVRNLELVEPLPGEDASSTLLGALDETATGMGARLLRQWILRPSIDIAEIEQRLGAVAALKTLTVAREEIYRELSGVLDLERLTSRITLGIASPRDLVALAQSLAHIPRVRHHLEAAPYSAARLKELYNALDELADVRERIATSIADEPPATLADPGFIRRGHDSELDELRDLSRNAKQVIAAMEERERQRTKIASLKIRYNQVFGYYIEISKANLRHGDLPADYERKQTLVNAERFTSPELKDYERKVLDADERIIAIERHLFNELREFIAAQAARIRRTAAAIAQADVLVNFARLAAERNFVRPEFTEESIGAITGTAAASAAGSPLPTGLPPTTGASPIQARHSSGTTSAPEESLFPFRPHHQPTPRGELLIAAGRHPVMESLLAKSGDRFVPNDLYFTDPAPFLLLITGPNMGGKSTYLRQTALIVLMAQMGSFVPAAQARLPLVDRIFTRIGASDNLARGRSTFLVEMSEVAAIVNTATSGSLVLLDEVGRGTATFDGLSIAWAVIESLCAHARPRTLFATHYHELTELEELIPGVKNVHVGVREQGQEIVFLRRVEPGPASRSYGIEVARLAGLPREVIERAREILERHEQSERELTEELSPGATLSPAGLPSASPALPCHSERVPPPLRDDEESASALGRRLSHPPKANVVPVQEVMFTPVDRAILDALRDADLESLRPLDALNLLDALKRQLLK
jgi:DNA mismatch repair protein MutS